MADVLSCSSVGGVGRERWDGRGGEGGVGREGWGGKVGREKWGGQRCGGRGGEGRGVEGGVGREITIMSQGQRNSFHEHIHQILKLSAKPLTNQ